MLKSGLFCLLGEQSLRDKNEQSEQETSAVADAVR